MNQSSEHFSLGFYRNKTSHARDWEEGARGGGRQAARARGGGRQAARAWGPGRRPTRDWWGRHSARAHRRPDSQEVPRPRSIVAPLPSPEATRRRQELEVQGSILAARATASDLTSLVSKKSFLI